MWHNYMKTVNYVFRLGSFLPQSKEDTPALSISFTPTTQDMSYLQQFLILDKDKHRILIPSHLSDASKLSQYPQVNAGGLKI